MFVVELHVVEPTSSPLPVEILRADEIRELENLLDLEKGWDEEVSLFREGGVGLLELGDESLLAGARCRYYTARSFCIALVKEVSRVYTYNAFRNGQGCMGDLYTAAHNVHVRFLSHTVPVGYQYAFEDILQFIFNVIDNKPRQHRYEGVVKFVLAHASGELANEINTIL